MTEHIAEMGKELFFKIVHPYKIGYNCNIKSKFLWPTDKDYTVDDRSENEKEC